MSAMTHDQYTELVGFLGRTFEERDHRMNALFEQSREEMRLFAEGIDARFERVDERLDSMNGRLGSLEGSFVSLEGWVRRAATDHESRLEALE